MMPALADIALAIGSSFALSLIIKATATLAATLISVRLARTRRAALRHLLLAAGFGVLLMLPMASAVIPTRAVVELPTIAATLPISLSAPVPAEFRPAARSTPAVSKEPLAIRSDRQPISELLAIAWATGALVFLVPVLVGLFQVRALRRSGRPWQHGMSVLQQVAKDAGMHRRVYVLLHDAVSGPASCGLLHPAIVLPADAQTWHDDELARAIVHELEHVRRADWASQCLARAVCACYWFHPLVWIAWRRLVLEAERTCDDAVLRDAEPTVYADQLVALAERLSTAPKPPLLAMANRTDLATRIAAVLDSRQPRGRAGRLAVVLVCVVAALLIATMSPLRVIAAAQGSGATPTFSGSLLDPFGRPLPNTKVTLWSVSTQQPVDAQSDQSGHFAFRELQAGAYRIQVRGFGSQGEVRLVPGQRLDRDIALLMAGGDYTLTVHRDEASTPLPPPPAPLPAAQKTSQPYANQADLDRCRQSSMFCRLTPPVQIARLQPIYPTPQRETGAAGTVVVEGRVGTDGLVKDLRAITAADPDFTSATIDALRRWQFAAMRLDDVAVESSLRVTVHFVVDSAQQIRPIRGQRVSGQFELDPFRRMEVETITLTFPAPELGREFTVDFTTRYLRDRPVPGPGSVDLVITQHPANDASPEVTIASDGRTLPLATQQQARRSVATTIPVAQVQRIADAGGIADQTFNVELQFSPEQVRALRATVDEWVKRLQP